MFGLEVLQKLDIAEKRIFFAILLSKGQNYFRNFKRNFFWKILRIFSQQFFGKLGENYTWYAIFGKKF